MAKQTIELSDASKAVRQSRQWLTLSSIAVVAAASLSAALLLSGCENVSGYSAGSLVRVIDASYNAPAINVLVEGTLLASNIGQGTITNYAGFGPSKDAAVKVTNANNTVLVTTFGTLLASQSNSVLVTDISAGYQVTVLQDQSTPAPTGHSDFRVLNEAPSTGPVDVYFLPGTAATNYATAKPVITALPVGGTSGYVAIPSSTLYMVIAPAGTTLTTTATTIYVSGALPLTGGEVRTVLVVDPQLVTEPVQVYTGNDVN
jgi:hypothetical protein